MSDSTVTDCDGILYDSGGPSGIYGNNEDLTFTVNGSGNIVIEFLSSFVVENTWDYLTIYDGPDTNSVVIAELTGQNIPLPGPFTAFSGSVTFHFESGNSVAYAGWMIQWDTQPDPPIPPDIVVLNDPNCGENILQVDFSSLIGCDWIQPEDLTLTGSSEISITDISPICVADSASAIHLTLGETFDYNCIYNIDLELKMPDACDSIWTFNLQTSFLMDQCNIVGTIAADKDSICAGDCVDLEFLVEGCLTYTYNWENGLFSGEGPHAFCPTQSTTYAVEVLEVETGIIETFFHTVEVVVADILDPDFATCQSGSPINLNSNPPLGVWEGPGITEGDQDGIFFPDSAFPGVNTIYFGATPFCLDSMVITVTEIDAGNMNAACPGSDPFQLDAIPIGGIWTGSYVTTGGVFSPDTIGVFDLYYTINGCVDTLTVNVDEIIGEVALETVCQTYAIDTIDFSPLGGLWTGIGIIDPLLGIFDPSEMPPGSFTYLYEINGCDQQFNIDVLEISSGQNWRNSCPTESPYIPYPAFSPTGGIWEGTGITDANTGLYDPSLMGDPQWSDLIYTAPNGCMDTIHMLNQTTTIPTDTLYFCEFDDPLLLDFDNIQVSPWAGIWTGTGLVNPEYSDYYFHPELANVGVFELDYVLNGCADSVIAVVFPENIIPDSLAFCSADEITTLSPSTPIGGWWSGPGIIDGATGQFDPSTPTLSNFYVHHSKPSGCLDSIYIEIETWEEVTMTGIEGPFCFNNTPHTVIVTPENGWYSGAIEDATFTTDSLGEGIHQVIYQYQTNFCYDSDTISFEVYPPIEAVLTTSDTLICLGNSATLNASASGGHPELLFDYTWQPELFPINQQQVFPDVSTLYSVVIGDGCSSTSIDSVYLQVLPPIIVTAATSDTLCFEDEGFAVANVLSAGNYQISWDSGDVLGDTIISYAGASHALNVVDIDNGCEFDSLILIPSFTPIIALFSVSPNADCINWEDNPVSIIDLSQHGIYGSWSTSDDQLLNYSPSDPPFFEFEQPGDYSINLEIFNEGDCESSFSTDICILPATPVFVADIFSPNEDGNNDILFVRGEGIEQMEFIIYDRWGERVFQSNNPNQGWDGRYRGKEMPTGVYVYYLKTSLSSGERLEMKGDITLVR